MQQILMDHTIKIVLAIFCIFGRYYVQDISSFYLVQQILLYVNRVGGPTAPWFLYSSDIKSALGSGRERESDVMKYNQLVAIS